MRFIYVRPQQPVLVEIPEPTVINVGIRLNDEARRGEHRHKREHDHSVRYESPLDTIPSEMDGFEQRGHTFEEQCDDDP